jgi:6-pyruvoyltetrahydropterin/6-carboxytetrahydropterin synthase
MSAAETPYYTSTKSYDNYPCCHRQWRHPGHCAFVHGYSRSFHFEFQCTALDSYGFVMDFGDLKAVKALLDDWFDHTLLLNADDPLLPQFEALASQGACKLKVLPNCGMEGTARFLFDAVNQIVQGQTDGRAWCSRVEVRENNKNSAIYSGPVPPLQTGSQA